MNTRKAIYYMILGTLAFTGMNVTLKFVTDYNAYQVVFFRSFTTLGLTSGLLAHRRIDFFGTHRKLLILRGILGASSMLLFFMTIHYMPLASAVALRYISPIFAGVFAVILLREKIRPLQWLFFVVAFLGVLALKGFDKDIPWIGLLLGLGSAMLSSLVYITIRRIGTREHPLVIINYFMFIATLVGGVGMLFDWKTPQGIDWLLLISLGIFGYLGQLFMTKAFQIGETNVVAPIKYVEVLFAVPIGMMYLNEKYTFWSFIGIAMIIGGLLLNMWYKKVSFKNKKV